MATTLDSFTSETQLTASETTLVFTGETDKKFIGAATVTNTGATRADIEVWRIGVAVTGTSGSGGNWLIKKSIPAGVTVRLDNILGQVLGNSMKISALSSIAGVLNVDISGTTET